MLNEQQLQAVKIISGPLAIIAGPGTGKTKTLVAKIEYIIAEKIAQPQEILALTFTNKAAQEIKDRLSKSGSSLNFDMPFVGTFHSFCRSVLDTHTSEPLQIVTESDRKKIVDQLLTSDFKNSELVDLSLTEVLLQLSKLKLDLNIIQNEKHNQNLSKLLNKYNQKLAELKIIDFDDLLIKTVSLLKTNKKILQTIGKKYQYILIDEFQDTHPIQYQLIKLISTQQPIANLTVIGDPLQSIYSFRGASDDIFQLFALDYPTAQTITLVINYRSRPQIINLSHSLFPDSTLLSPHDQLKAEIKFITTLNEQSESQLIIDKINDNLGGTSLHQASNYATINQRDSFNDFAIIFRTHHLAHNLQKNLNRSGFPYQTIGSVSLFETKEISFLLTSFNYLLMPNLTLDSKYSFLKFARDELIKLDKYELVNRLLAMTKYDQVISKSSTKQQNLQNFFLYLNQFHNADWLKKSVEYFHQLQQQDYFDQHADRITLLTMHAAKGLEFKHVFIIGFEQDLIPHSKRQTDLDTIEEKRLLYVAFSRAKESLTVINCQERFKQNNRIISPFFKQLDINTFTTEIDPQINKIIKYRQKVIQQNKQSSLF